MLQKYKFHFIRLVMLTTYSFILFSCNNSSNDKEIEYYEDGSIRSLVEINSQGLREGEFIEYYPEGNTMRIALFKNDTLNGFYKLLYKDGSIKEKGKYKNGLPIGWIEYYDKDNYINQKNQYVIIEDTSYLNQIIFYKKDGEIDYSKSYFFKFSFPVNEPKDTVKVRMSLHVPNDTISYIGLIMIHLPHNNDSCLIYRLDENLRSEFYAICDANNLISGEITQSYTINDSLVKEHVYYFKESTLRGMQAPR
nr:hypothetical protein [uncultured Carboxylicivirga sp.]